jgi:hypothetical protein
MTWKHIGKTSGFNHIFLDYQYARELGISGLQARDNKIAIRHSALSMLQNLPSFDQEQMLKEIRQVIAHPYQTSSIKHKRFFNKRMIRSKTPFRNYHYLISYSTHEKIKVHGKSPEIGIVIEDILFDYDAVGARPNSSAERTLMYHVEQMPSGGQYDNFKTKDEIDQFEEDWETPKPVSIAKTIHVTINGMLNDLNKAAWLMGVHTQAAYRKDNVKAYTLFHNPSDGGGLDLMECLYDKSGLNSHNAQQLSSILVHQARKPTKWTVHSQGAIIFHSALTHYKRNGGGALNQHQLAIHGSGTNVAQLKSIAQSMSVQIVGVRNNPFDLVPNVIAGNNRSPGSLARCLTFGNLVVGNNIGASPHTLPYLGIEIYHRQLLELGFHKKAKMVKKYIEKNCV